MLHSLKQATILVAAVLTAAWQAFALDPHQPLGSYLRTVFTQEDGLPNNIVNGIAQSDGFLWLATASSLVRFDGRRFFEIALTPQVVGIYAIVAGPEGDLWLATNHGVLRVALSYLGHTGPFSTTQYLGDDSVSTLCAARNGVIWAGTSKGLFRLTGSQFSQVIPDVTLVRIEEMPDGHVFLVTTQGGVIEWDGAQAINRVDIIRKFGGAKGQIYHIHQERTGTLWIGSDRGLGRYRDGKVDWLTLTRKDGKPASAYRIYEEAEGSIWVSMEGSGMHRVQGNEPEPLSPLTGGRAIFEDRDGNLWFGTNGSGLVRLRNRLVRMFTHAEGLPNDTVMTVLAAHDGTLWVGNNCGGLSWLDGERFHSYDETRGLTNSCVFSLSEAPNGDIWLGTSGGGIFRFRAGQFTQYSMKEGLASSVVRAVVAARDGAIWAATSAGVSCMRDGRIRNYTTSDGLSDGMVRNIYQDRNGTMWFATVGGIRRFAGDRFVSAIHLTSGSPLWLLGEDPEGHLYFTGHDPITFRSENTQLRYSPLLGGAMIPLGQDLWSIHSDHGILRVNAEGLQKWDTQLEDPVDYTTFGVRDGLSSRDYYGGLPLMAVTADHRVWAAVSGGLAMIDIGHQPRSTAKPVTYVGEISVDGHKQASGRELILPPGPHRVELDFDSIELTSPSRTRLQYRLDVGDQKWLDAGPIHTAVYSRVPLGRHQFHVRATNSDGIWDREGIVYWVDQRPTYYETDVFRAAMIVFGLLLVVALYQLRLRQAAEKLNARLEGRLAERVQIARDLHDTTLQGIQGLVMLFRAGIDRLPEPEPAREFFEKALAHASNVIAEGRERLQNLRISPLERKQLPEALTLAGQEIVQGSAIELQVGTQGVARTLRPETADEAFCIAREALLNAVIHSGGRRIEVAIVFGRRHLRLHFRDDGHGIDPETLRAGGRAGHWGLAGMRERADKVGGKLEFASRPGGGTEVILSIPASAAYQKSRILRPWFH